ncbi:MAG: beta-carotene 15,15'-dioxygenase, Brp/Blh family [Flavobacteriales bacterium]|nr:beta-carotene 15,15'-dioxygenase, Brp/Blh family [Flavobacteriales bacterium]
MNYKTSNPDITIVDYAFVGFGAANCLFILRLIDQNLLEDKTIAIIEPDSKTKNDRTFCFWATEKEVLDLGLDNLISHKWENIEIGGISQESIAPLKYFHIKGIDLYTETRKKLAICNVTFFNSFLIKSNTLSLTFHELILENEIIQSTIVFDSRPPSYSKPINNQSHLYQSFYGWNISMDKGTFDANKMVLMDFKIPQQNSTQFVYILPFSENKALVELTRFSEKKLTPEEANSALKDYMAKINPEYKIIDTEKGVLPMSSAKIETIDLGKNWINMGSRSHKLKCTTGFAFHAMAEDAAVKANNLKNQLSIQTVQEKNRFAFYDRLLLKILHESPEKGKPIFETLFSKVSTSLILNFLREKTSLKQDLYILSKLPKTIFILTAIKDIYHKISSFPTIILPTILTLCGLIFSVFNLDYVTYFLLILGFFSVGLSHGALDHLTGSPILNKTKLLIFSITYIAKGALFGVVWFFTPGLALLLFILYSAWHFGQADFKEWKLTNSLFSFVWGCVLLILILLFHVAELLTVLEQIPNLNHSALTENLEGTRLLVLQLFTVLIGVILALYHKSIFILLTITYLLLSTWLPLLVSFGIYFVFQHSMNGWKHLKNGLNKSSKTMWKESFPFNLGGSLLIIGFYLFGETNQLGTFFIIISCLSLPHVLSMHNFYMLKRK